MLKEDCRVIEQIEIADSIYKLTVEGDIALTAEPGQFVHVKTGGREGPLLRRPISISSINREARQFTMIFRAAGRGTFLLASLLNGMAVDILGPLGNGYPLSEAWPGSTALLVGGGIGIPPLYELSRQLTLQGVKVTHVLGFQTASVVFYEQEFSALGKTYITTVDGTYGEKGYVTDTIFKEQIDFDTLFACGPIQMLKALETGFPNKKAFLSLEERMGCGVGACFACVCKVHGDPDGRLYKKICSDGPVFRAGEVVL
ncbi:dihydroorotate dehydrogenase electron transfer subunit [Neobacillus notoginsengisoli]|uniref:dihydroorotate dehydrogenase electron transfer subunit n=1 Tax=Neobacillus notoginsengisoli TaxID=1578198 RepID=UPI0023D9679F|nr:dihydroorotate dehydrogenase electron transfer subunit [Neobacillus notoginsengisoli]